MDLKNKTYLGFDFSTQQVKVLVMGNDLKVLQEENVNFDRDLSEFKTNGGVHVHKDNLTVTAPTEMWVKALDIVLSKLKMSGFDFASVCAVSGTAQQHGSVYWKHGASKCLRELTAEDSLHDQLKNCFSVVNSPVWMDSSTQEQSKMLETVAGGAQQLANITGARSFERFTGAQIAKISQNCPEKYIETERISLISSFAASLFLGEYANIDNSDGSGMNLLNIRTKIWDENLLKAAGENLKEKLGATVPACSVLGTIAEYYVKKFNFNPDCKVIAFTGDNPASLAGCRLTEGDIIVSLGTSDTLFLWINDPKPDTICLVSVNPIDDAAHMGLLCFKNGSLTRERIRDSVCNGSWDKFAEYLHTSKPGNDGNMGIYFDVQEITPNAVGVHRFDADNKSVVSFDSATEVRALVEGQFIAKRFYAEKLGYKISPSTRILATGGASCNKEILQVLSDVFQADVYTIDTSNSACLGSAYRAKHGLLNQIKPIDFSEVVKGATPYSLACKFNPYTYDISRYGKLIDMIL